MPCLTSVDAPPESRLVLEDGLTLERDPIAAEGAVAGVVLDGNGGGQLFKFLDVRSVGSGAEGGQLFVRTRKHEVPLKRGGIISMGDSCAGIYKRKS